MNQFLDEKELQEIMRDHTDSLLRLAFLYVKDWPTAEDIVQEVYLTYYQKFDQYEGRSSVKTYLSKITVNKCKDYLKSWRYRMQVLTNSFTTKQQNNRNQIVEQDEKLELADAVLQLPIKYREVIIYYYFEELSVIEVAHVLNVSENTVKTRLRKARMLLKDKISNRRWEVLLNE